METDKNDNKLLQDLVPLFKEMNDLSNRELDALTPLVHEVIKSKSRDTKQIEFFLERLLDLVLSGIGIDIFTELLNYLQTFNPILANEIQEVSDGLLGRYDLVVEDSKKIAQVLHAGQLDKAGVDYFSGHLTTVGESGCGWKDKVVGYLHDVAEDTSYSVKQALDMLQSKCHNQISDKHYSEIEEALNLLNSSTAATREEYIARIRKSVIATRVKLNDLTHNMEISRITNPTNKDFERIERYKKEYRTILEYLGPVNWE